MTILATAIVFVILGIVIGFVVCANAAKGIIDSELTKLSKFMKNRPHDRDKNIIEATKEYIEQIEVRSVERYQELNQ